MPPNKLMASHDFVKCSYLILWIITMGGSAAFQSPVGLRIMLFSKSFEFFSVRRKSDKGDEMQKCVPNNWQWRHIFTYQMKFVQFVHLIQFIFMCSFCAATMWVATDIAWTTRRLSKRNEMEKWIFLKSLTGAGVPAWMVSDTKRNANGNSIQLTAEKQRHDEGKVASKRNGSAANNKTIPIHTDSTHISGWAIQGRPHPIDRNMNKRFE